MLAAVGIDRGVTPRLGDGARGQQVERVERRRVREVASFRALAGFDDPKIFAWLERHFAEETTARAVAAMAMRFAPTWAQIERWLALDVGHGTAALQMLRIHFVPRIVRRNEIVSHPDQLYGGKLRDLPEADVIEAAVVACGARFGTSLAKQLARDVVAHLREDRATTLTPLAPPNG